MPNDPKILKRLRDLEATVAELRAGNAELRTSHDRLEDIVYALASTIHMQGGWVYLAGKGMTAQGRRHEFSERFEPPTGEVDGTKGSKL